MTKNINKRLRPAVPVILLACIFLSSNASASLIHLHNYNGNASDSVGIAIAHSAYLFLILKYFTSFFLMLTYK